MLPLDLSFNKILMLCIGLSLIVYGIWLGKSPGSRLLGVSLFFTGVGSLLFGITNGFSDMSLTGRLLYRMSLIAYLIGLPILTYYLTTVFF